MGMIVWACKVALVFWCGYCLGHTCGVRLGRAAAEAESLQHRLKIAPGTGGVDPQYFDAVIGEEDVWTV
jgi:hypothetical protein